jgi:uncharacterized membrane protein
MAWSKPTIAVVSIGFLHVLFMLGELLPWESPLIMNLVLDKWGLHLPTDQSQFVSTVVHNAGIYNGIVGAGLFAAASLGPQGRRVQLALLTGGVVAGVVGGLTLSPATFVQAILGVIALAVVLLA